jgi:hypothetical protein
MACSCNTNPTQNCENPCGVTTANTAACEALSSQIQNFSDAFFGLVVKTEVNGVVTWSLPCGLDVGLVGNPRAEGEGLACYFLRLFNDGIVGLKGDTGAAGAAGATGHNAYSVTTQTFVQPTLGSPNVTVLTSYNPALLAGMYVFITGSGWYLVNNTDVSGSLSLTLTKTVTSPPVGNVTAGKLVVPSGYPGASVVGPPGAKGDKGDTGSAAASLTTENHNYFATVGTNYPLPIVYAAVDFINSAPTVLLSVVGKYLVTATVTIVGKTGVATTDFAFFKLRNTTNSGDIPGSERKKNFMVDTQYETITISAIVTTDGINQTVALYGKCTTDAKIDAVALFTTLVAVRIE